MKKKMKRNAGFTMVELMVASTVSSIGLVVLMGSTVAVDNHQAMSDYESTGTSFSQNVLEFLQNEDFTDFEDLATYDPGVTGREGTVSVPGFGTATFELYAVIAQDGGQTKMFKIGVDDPAGVLDPPDTVEVQAVLTKIDSKHYGYEYTASTMVSF